MITTGVAGRQLAAQVEVCVLLHGKDGSQSPQDVLGLTRPAALQRPVHVSVSSSLTHTTSRALTMIPVLFSSSPLA